MALCCPVAIFLSSSVGAVTIKDTLSLHLDRDQCPQIEYNSIHGMELGLMRSGSSSVALRAHPHTLKPQARAARSVMKAWAGLTAWSAGFSCLCCIGWCPVFEGRHQPDVRNAQES